MRGPPRSPRITTACLWLVYTRAHASAIDRAFAAHATVYNFTQPQPPTSGGPL